MVVEEKHHIHMTKELGKGIEDMCNLGISIAKTNYNKGEKVGYHKGEKTGYQKGERNGYHKGNRQGRDEKQIEVLQTFIDKGFSLKYALDFLDIPASKYAYYEKRLKKLSME